MYAEVMLELNFSYNFTAIWRVWQLGCFSHIWCRADSSLKKHYLSHKPQNPVLQKRKDKVVSFSTKHYFQTDIFFSKLRKWSSSLNILTTLVTCTDRVALVWCTPYSIEYSAGFRAWKEKNSTFSEETNEQWLSFIWCLSATRGQVGITVWVKCCLDKLMFDTFMQWMPQLVIGGQLFSCQNPDVLDLDVAIVGVGSWLCTCTECIIMQ